MAEQPPRRPGRAASDQQSRTKWLVIGLAVVVLVLVGVVVFLIVDDSGSDSATPATTTTTVPVTTTTAPATTSTPTTTAPLPTTPEGYAQTLFTAWQTNNKALAVPGGVGDGREPDLRPDLPDRRTNPYVNQGCQGAAGSIICTWQGNGQVIVVTVRNLTGGLPIQVENVEFQSKS